MTMVCWRDIPSVTKCKCNTEFQLNLLIIRKLHKSGYKANFAQNWTPQMGPKGPNLVTFTFGNLYLKYLKFFCTISDDLDNIKC